MPSGGEEGEGEGRVVVNVQGLGEGKRGKARMVDCPGSVTANMGNCCSNVLRHKGGCQDNVTADMQLPWQ